MMGDMCVRGGLMTPFCHAKINNDYFVIDGG